MEIASRGQLRLAFLRWAVVTVPFVLLLGFTSGRSVAVGDANRWYMELAKPPIMPPSWAFPVAWTALYILLGLALAIVINARGSRLRGIAIGFFAVQLAFNLAWTPLFFGAHQVFWALMVIGIMIVLTLATIVIFARIRIGAALLMLPYLAWICFAAYLNLSIHQLNPNAETLVPSSSTTQMVI